LGDWTNLFSVGSSKKLYKMRNVLVFFLMEID